MSFCTFFCFYGTIALFFDRKNVKGGIQSIGTSDIPKPQQKQSDFVDGLLHGSRRLSTTSNTSNTKELELTSTSISDSFMDNDESNASLSLSTQSLSDDPKTIISNTTIPEESIIRRTNEQLITTITLTFALLLQSIANTIFTVLWPLLAHDIFDLSAHTFGILTFISSVISTGAVASFPVIEKLDKVGGRVRCAAKGFGIGSLLCILFCFCSFGGIYQEGVEDLVGVEEYDNNIGFQLNNSGTRSLIDQQSDTIEHQLHSRKQLALHFLSAIAFQAILSVLEPSLKSILSLQSSKSKALGGTIGGMQSLLNLGGMVGNLAGTILYKVSRDMKGNEQSGGSLPFTVTAFFMFICSILIWRLEEPAHLDANIKEYNIVSDSDIESGGDIDRGCASRVLKFD